MPPSAKSFKTQGDFRAWLETHHADATELLVRIFKVHAKHRGVTNKEAVDEALCFGWIDGVRRALDEDSFTVRFSPRKAKSYWSRINRKRAAELEAEGRMHPAGLAAFHGRDKPTQERYSFETAPRELDAASQKLFRANRKAWDYFEAQAPWYRRTSAFYVMSAKREETRARRLQILIDCCAKGRPLPGLERNK
ncbi:MAG TPA: YdeI/OmpD-associated family protein [Gemmatimonadaceae bacterium]|nr:YdeI/OmpD-associated family protein [Gemmatimonadaceae bacterium]